MEGSRIAGIEGYTMHRLGWDSFLLRAGIHGGACSQVEGRRNAILRGFGPSDPTSLKLC